MAMYLPQVVYSWCMAVINPRRTCPTRVTVLGLCVCLCVCVCYSTSHFFTWLFMPKTILTFSAADEGQNFKRFSRKMLRTITCTAAPRVWHFCAFHHASFIHIGYLCMTQHTHTHKRSSSRDWVMLGNDLCTALKQILIKTPIPHCPMYRTQTSYQLLQPTIIALDITWWLVSDQKSTFGCDVYTFSTFTLFLLDNASLYTVQDPHFHKDKPIHRVSYCACVGTACWGELEEMHRNCYSIRWLGLSILCIGQ